MIRSAHHRITYQMNTLRVARPYILKIREAKPDLVIGGLTSGDLSNFLKQWKELGLLEKIPFTEIAVGDTDLWSIGPAVAAGLYTSLW